MDATKPLISIFWPIGILLFFFFSFCALQTEARFEPVVIIWGHLATRLSGPGGQNCYSIKRVHMSANRVTWTRTGPEEQNRQQLLRRGK